MTDQTAPNPADPPPPDPEPTSPGDAEHRPGPGDTLTSDQAPPFVAPPPPPARPAGPARRLYRSTNDRKVGGVAAGVAEFLGIDPTIVRIATLLLAFTGVGILVYIAMWIIVPEAPDGTDETQRPGLLAGERNTNVAIGVGAIALAVGILSGSWALLAFALIGGGVWLLSEQTAGSDSRFTGDGNVTENARVSGDPRSAAADPPPGSWALTDSAPSSRSHGADTQPIAPPAQPRRRQKITGITLSLVAMLIGVSIAAEAGDWWHTSAVVVLGLVIALIGGGVIAGVIAGHGARGLVPIGILAVFALVPVAALDGLVDDGLGESVYQPQRIEDLRASYRLGIGSLTLDLSDLDFDGRSERVDIDVGMGEVVVIVPRNVGGTVELDAGAGELSFDATDNPRLATSDDGVNVSMGPIPLEGTEGTLELDIHVGLGAASIEFAGGR